VRQKVGRIIVAGITKEVTFEPVEGPINDLIDGAYGRSTMVARISAGCSALLPLRDS